MPASGDLTFPPNPDRIVQIPLSQLHLDRQNPRLAYYIDASQATREKLLSILWTEMAVEEVAMSIAENGYFSSEPLLVIPDETGEQTYTVVEGNRRLAAVLLLRDEELRRAVRATDLPLITLGRSQELERLPAIVYACREDVWTTLGFRHINGIHPWDSLSKAQYVADVHEKYGVPLEAIAKAIGDKHSTVSRLYRGLKLLEQADNETNFDRGDISGKRLYFSHLYTAAAQEQFQSFLGIDADSSLKPNPVPTNRLSQLEELLVWLYGTHDRPAVVRTQNPDLNSLRLVVADDEAIATLRDTRDLDKALNQAIGDVSRFSEALREARTYLRQAMETISGGYSGQQELDRVLDEVVSLVRNLRDTMRSVRVREGIEQDDL